MSHWESARLVDDAGTPIRGEAAVAYVTTCVRAGGDADFYAVLTVAADGKPADVCHTGNGPNSQRNARRIAALPDLEACLQEMVDRFESPDEAPGYVLRARAALAKAQPAAPLEPHGEKAKGQP